MSSTNIHEDARNGDLAKVEALLKENPDLVFSKDQNGNTPLHQAAWHNHKDVVELLLTSKAEINAKGNFGCSPFCISPRSAFDEWKRTKRGALEVVLHTTTGPKLWKSSIGISPEPNKVSVVSFENNESSNIEPPLASLGLGRNSGHSFFVRSVAVEDPPRRLVRFILGVAYRSSQWSITNGDAPALFLNPGTPKKHFWELWK